MKKISSIFSCVIGICSLLTVSTAAKAQYVISTVAGNDSAGYSGDGGPATVASLSAPYGIAADGSGSLFIADYHNQRIRKVSSSGIISTVAGNGSLGFSGDGGPATAASLKVPLGVAVDGSGNLFIADQVNSRIRKVSSSGIISTVAGNGSFSYSGDGGPATAAGLNQPDGVAVDGSGNLYIVDLGNYVIRKVSPSGIISTVAGNGSMDSSGDGGAATAASFMEPVSVAIDGSGNLFIADKLNSRIRKVSSSGIISTVAGNGSFSYSGDGGPATAASLYFPYSVIVDGGGNLFIADEDNSRIRKVSPSGIISTVAGNGSSGYSGDGGPATAASLNVPSGVAVSSGGNLFIADGGNEVVRKISPIAESVPAIGPISGNSIHAYPNPSNGLLFIDIDVINDHADIAIIDATGKDVATLQTKNKNTKLDMRDLACGVYLIRVKTGGKLYEVKVEKK